MTVVKAVPIIPWANPADLVYGTALSDTPRPWRLKTA
jgi:hypothetical protein